MGVGSSSKKARLRVSVLRSCSARGQVQQEFPGTKERSRHGTNQNPLEELTNPFQAVDDKFDTHLEVINSPYETLGFTVPAAFSTTKMMCDICGRKKRRVRG